MASPFELVHRWASQRPDQCPECGNVRENAMMMPCGHSLCHVCMVPKLSADVGSALACRACNKGAPIIMPVSDLRDEISSVLMGRAAPDTDIEKHDSDYAKIAAYNAQHAGEFSRDQWYIKVWRLVLMFAIMVRTSWWYFGTLVLLLVLDMLAIFVRTDLIPDRYGFVGRLDDIFLVLFSVVLAVYLVVWQRRRIISRSILMQNILIVRSQGSGRSLV